MSVHERFRIGAHVPSEYAFAEKQFCSCASAARNQLPFLVVKETAGRTTQRRIKIFS
jgi:hypothetical protein